jgi:hypothetical protein
VGLIRLEFEQGKIGDNTLMLALPLDPAKPKWFEYVRRDVDYAAAVEN